MQTTMSQGISAGPAGSPPAAPVSRAKPDGQLVSEDVMRIRPNTPAKNKRDMKASLLNILTCKYLPRLRACYTGSQGVLGMLDGSI
jgi:hypothetical protein